MNNFFQKNIAALSSHSPAANRLARRLSEKIAALTTPAGCVTIKYGDLLIHSAYDPVKEGQLFAKNVRPGDLVCLYGFGLGYHVEPLLEKIGPGGFLLIVELNPDLLGAAMILRDQTAVLSNSRLHLVFGEEETQVAAEISKYMAALKPSASGAAPAVLFHPPSFKCIPGHFKRIANALEILQMERRVPAVFGDLESENYAFNQEIAARSPGVKTLRGRHKDRPAILASAGPSLDDILPYLQKMSSGSVLACVDTALPILTREGLAPQYVFSLDPQEESFRYFADCLENAATLVYLPTANARILHSYRGEKIVAFKEGHSLFKDNDALPREKGTTRSGGSVSCFGLDCLMQMGCDPIFLAGQDCAFSGDRTYSRHAEINDQLIDMTWSAATLKQLHRQKSREKKRVAVKCCDGSESYTNQMMYSYLRYIEEIAEKRSETKIYNLLSHGAGIENVEPLGSVNELAKTLFI